MTNDQLFTKQAAEAPVCLSSNIQCCKGDTGNDWNQSWEAVPERPLGFF